jgi:hypothetical protein
VVHPMQIHHLRNKRKYKDDKGREGKWKKLFLKGRFMIPLETSPCVLREGKLHMNHFFSILILQPENKLHIFVVVVQ